MCYDDRKPHVLYMHTLKQHGPCKCQCAYLTLLFLGLTTDLISAAGPRDGRLLSWGLKGDSSCLRRRLARFRFRANLTLTLAAFSSLLIADTGVIASSRKRGRMIMTKTTAGSTSSHVSPSDTAQPPSTPWKVLDDFDAEPEHEDQRQGCEVGEED